MSLTESDIGTRSALPTLHSWPAVIHAELRATFTLVRNLPDSAPCMSSTNPITGEVSMLIMLLHFEKMTNQI